MDAIQLMSTDLSFAPLHHSSRNPPQFDHPPSPPAEDHAEGQPGQEGGNGDP